MVNQRIKFKKPRILRPRKPDGSLNKLRQREMETILAVATAMRVAQTSSEIISVVLEEIEKLMDTDGISVALVNPVSGGVTVVAARNYLEVSKGLTLQPGEGATGMILKNRQPYLAEDVRTDPHLLYRDAAPENMTQLGFPLVANDKSIGVIWMCRRYSINDADFRVLGAIADMAANAINRATLNEQTELHLQRLSSLREIDRAINSSLDLNTTLSVVVDQTITHLKVDAAAIMLYYPSQHTLQYNNTNGFHYQYPDLPGLKLGEGYAGRAVLSRQPVFTKDVRPENDVGRKYIFDQEGFISFGVYPLIAKGEVKGVLEIFHRSMLTPDQEWFDYFEALAGQAAIAVHNAELFYNISRTNLELIAAYDDTIEGWSRALEMRDRETVGHSRRVTQMTIRLARELDYPEEDLTILRQGVLLHDIGKMGIPDSILLKPGPLNEEEWASMRRHPEYARDFLNSIPHLRTTAVVPYTHHERWNGSGYPQGLSGESIPLASRVFMVVDVWDALSHERPYKTAWPQAEVLKYLSDNAGILFDPKVVSVFLELYRQGEFDAYGIYSEPIEIVR